MLGNDDNSNIKINVNKGGNGTPEGTISIDISEYKALLESRYGLFVVKDVLFSNAKLDCMKSGRLMFNVFNDDINVIMNYLFKNECAERFAELTKEDGE
nr:MAG TPA: hypothetical protein [Caudoviricetes sp.]